MAGTKVWSTWAKNLAVATEEDFARKIAPILRILCPDLVPTPPRLHWDASGIDYVSWVDEGAFPFVVQCKGFHVQGLGDSQVSQIKKSIVSFLESGASCGTYLLVHNRDGRFHGFNEAVMVLLNTLTSNGVAKSVRLLDRHAVLNEAKALLTDRIHEDIRKSSVARRTQINSLFGIDLPYVSVVPVREGALKLRRDTPSTVVLDPQIAQVNISRMLVSKATKGWALLEGSFGSGKTTTALEAASLGERTVIVLQCGQIPPADAQSLRKGLQRSANLDLAFVQHEGDRPAVEELAASILVQLLSANDASEKYLLIVDGLDENRIFATLSGLQALVNQFADLECGVVLTARSEHFSALFGNYSSALSELSWKYGKSQTIGLVQLQPWEQHHILRLLDTVLQSAPSHTIAPLISLRDLLSSPGGEALYGDLPSNPLLLRFLIDDVASEGIRVRTKASLLDAWARRKFWRDAEKRSTALLPGQDLTAFVEMVYRITETIAGTMLEQQGEGYLLLEGISSEAIVPLLESALPRDHDPILNLLLHSVLTPGGRRTGRSLEIRFAFRVFQEFFLASFLIREGRPTEGFPDSVRDLAAELAGSRS